MNRNTIFLVLLFTGIVSAGIISCKKEPFKKKTDSKENAVVYLQQAVTYPKGLVIYPLTDDARTLTLNASFGAVGLPKTDVAVKLQVDDHAFDSINAQRQLGGLPLYEKFPANAFEVDGWDVSIPGGSLASNSITLKYYSRRFDPNKYYLLPISIISASGYGVNPSLKTVFLAVEKLEIKEGEYAATGIRKNFNADGSSGGESAISANKILTRYNNPSNPASVEFDINAVANLAPGRPGTIFRVVVNSDLTCSVYGQLDAPTQPIVHIAGKPNYYDPILKSFVLNYKYTLTSGAWREMSETLKKN